MCSPIRIPFQWLTLHIYHVWHQSTQSSLQFKLIQFLYSACFGGNKEESRLLLAVDTNFSIAWSIVFKVFHFGKGGKRSQIGSQFLIIN